MKHFLLALKKVLPVLPVIIQATRIYYLDTKISTTASASINQVDAKRCLDKSVQTASLSVGLRGGRTGLFSNNKKKKRTGVTLHWASPSFRGHIRTQSTACGQRSGNICEAESICPSFELVLFKLEQLTQGQLASVFIGPFLGQMRLYIRVRCGIRAFSRWR